MSHAGEIAFENSCRRDAERRGFCDAFNGRHVNPYKNDRYAKDMEYDMWWQIGHDTYCEHDHLPLFLTLAFEGDGDYGGLAKATKMWEKKGKLTKKARSYVW